MNRNHHKYETRETYYNRVPLRKHTSVMSKLEVDSFSLKPVKSVNDIHCREVKSGRSIKGNKKGNLPSIKSSGLIINSRDDPYTSNRLAKWNSVYKRVMVVNRLPKPTKRTAKRISSGRVSL